MSATEKPAIAIDYDDDKHRYKVNGIDVPSVTQVLDATEPKPALTWWGMRVGMAAVVRLVKDGKLTWPVIQAFEHDWRSIFDKKSPHFEAGKALLEPLVVANKLSTNHVKEEAGTLGTSTHEAAVRLAAGEDVALSDFPKADRGYVQAIYAFWDAFEPEVIEQEVIVGSLEHLFAGRFDLIAEIDDVALDQHEELRPGRVMIDWKTGSGIYPSHHLQLSGYEIGLLETSDERVDDKWIVQLRQDGTFKRVRGLATAEQFLNRRRSYTTDKQLEERIKLAERNQKGRTR